MKTPFWKAIILLSWIFLHHLHVGSAQEPQVVDSAEAKKGFQKAFGLECSTPGNGIFRSGEKCVVEARIRPKKKAGRSLEYRWVLQDAWHQAVGPASKTRRLVFNDPGPEGAEKQVESRIRYELPVKQPGFYILRFEVVWQVGNGNQWVPVQSVRVGYQPTEILSPLTAEKDFDRFWRESMAELAKIEPDYRVRLVKEKSDEQYRLYEVEMKSLGGVRVGGWLELPVSQQPLPCLMRVPGYTQSMKSIGRDRLNGIAVFSFNIRGHGNSQKDVSGKPEDYWIRGLDNRQDYFYRGAYLDCVRAMDFLRSRKEIDPQRLAVRGGSQGGGLALVTAALCEDLVLCVSDITFLVDWQNYFRITDWPEVNRWIAARKERTRELMLRTMSYFDLMNFARRIRCETVMGVGLQDPICPPTTLFATYNRITAKKSFRVYPKAGHWVPGEHHSHVWSLILNRLSNRPGDPSTENGKGDPQESAKGKSKEPPSRLAPGTR